MNLIEEVRSRILTLFPGIRMTGQSNKRKIRNILELTTCEIDAGDASKQGDKQRHVICLSFDTWCQHSNSSIASSFRSA